MTVSELPAEGFDETGYLTAYPDVAAAVAAGHFESGWHHYESHGRAEGRSPVGAVHATPPPSTEAVVTDGGTPANPLLRFEQRPPSDQTAVDVFRGRWASDLGPVLGVSGTGAALLFSHDSRPAQAAAVLGQGGLLSGMTVLELGPLEAAHTYLLEKLDAASVVAVEASVEAYLKCLIVKELLNLRRSRFLLGDILEYLAASPERVDLVFCSGVLYHMADPVELIRRICNVSDRCFVWSHYYDAERHPVPFQPEARHTDGFATTYWSHTYGDRSAQFWGGNKQTATWLERDALLAAFRHFGLTDITVIQDDRDHPNGPGITFAARRGVSAVPDRS